MFISALERKLLEDSIEQFMRYVQQNPSEDKAGVQRTKVRQELKGLRIRLTRSATTNDDIPVLAYCVGFRTKLVETAIKIGDLRDLTAYANALRRLHSRLEEEARIAGITLATPDYPDLSRE